MTRVATMLTAVVTSITLGSSAFVDPPKTLIWNASASAPVGLYAVQAANDLAVTDLVAVMPPPLIAEFLADRGYLPNGMPLLKRILALPGQTICRNGLDILPMAPPTAARANVTRPVASSQSGKAAAASPTANSFS